MVYLKNQQVFIKRTYVSVNTNAKYYRFYFIIIKYLSKMKTSCEGVDE